MKILLTNDDGIEAEGLWAIYKELKKFADVIVVAPDTQKSSVGHGITLGKPITHKIVGARSSRPNDNRRGNDLNGSGNPTPAWHAIGGTPSDCVKFALNVLLKKKPDAVVSGINLGPNDGHSVFYSGTVAGAREGSFANIPSVALSLATFRKPDYSYAAKVGAKIVKIIVGEGSPRPLFPGAEKLMGAETAPLLNVNVPNLPKSKIKGIKNTCQGTVPIVEVFKRGQTPLGSDPIYYLSGKLPKKRNNDNEDTYLLQKGYVTITPLQNDLTDNEFLRTGIPAPTRT
ncbi:MAG: 5'/3'-nucleotidase SurE [Candidatus Zapsychrus exili]|nr:5'/3'-nucleotidase SurE [Candidatus Zapsychrus exili]